MNKHLKELFQTLIDYGFQALHILSYLLFLSVCGLLYQIADQLVFNQLILNGSDKTKIDIFRIIFGIGSGTTIFYYVVLDVVKLYKKIKKQLK